MPTEAGVPAGRPRWTGAAATVVTAKPRARMSVRRVRMGWIVSSSEPRVQCLGVDGFFCHCARNLSGGLDRDLVWSQDELAAKLAESVQRHADPDPGAAGGLHVDHRVADEPRR